MGARTRSFWGWGYEDRFPDDDQRRALAMQVGALLAASGVERSGEIALLPLPTRDATLVAAPRVTPPAELAACASTDAPSRIAHTYGRSYRDLVRGFRGDFRSAPDCVATPSTEREIEALFRWCAVEPVAPIPSGVG